MKLDTQKQHLNRLQNDDFEDIEYGIDAENMGMAIKAFYQYSDPISAFIREIASNGYDAHIEAGVDKPVTVRYSTAHDHIQFIDYGTGLSPALIRQVYSKFFSSTKRETNDQIGAFGLGSKSPLSYSESVEIHTKYGDTLYKYIIHKGDGIPQITKLDESLYTGNSYWDMDENGTAVIIPTQKKDVSEIKKALRTQLAYFDNLIIFIDGTAYHNEYTVHKGEHFIFRSDKDNKIFKNAHICMGKVYYPVDIEYSHIRSFSDEEITQWTKKLHANHLFLASSDKVNICSSIHDIFDIPMGLYFDIGEIPIVWNRENIEYSREVRKTIIDKAVDAAIELRETAIKVIKPLDHIKDYMNEPKVPESKPEVVKSFLKQSVVTKITHIDDRLKIWDEEVKKAEKDNIISYAYTLNNLLKNAITIENSDIYGDIRKRIIYEESELYRWPLNESRKRFLQKYIQQHMSDICQIRLNEKDEFIENVISVRQPGPEADRIKTKAGQVWEQINEWYQSVPHVNSIEIPEDFSLSPVADKNSSIYMPVRSWMGDSFRASYSNELANFDTVIYGFTDERSELDAVGSLLSSLAPTTLNIFNNGCYSKSDTPLSIVGRSNVESLSKVYTMIHWKDLLRSRRFITPLLTIRLVNKYFDKYPEFRYCINYLFVHWEEEDFHKTGVPLTFQQIRTLRKADIEIENRYSYNYSQELYEESIKRGLKHKYYNVEFLNMVTRVHGTILKYGPLLAVDPRIEIKFKQQQIDRITPTLPLNIHPRLILKHYVHTKKTSNAGDQ